MAERVLPRRRHVRRVGVEPNDPAVRARFERVERSCIEAITETIMADTSITLDTGATVNGRSLAGAVAPSGAVTMDSNQASLPACN